MVVLDVVFVYSGWAGAFWWCSLRLLLLLLLFPESNGCRLASVRRWERYGWCSWVRSAPVARSQWRARHVEFLRAMCVSGSGDCCCILCCEWYSKDHASTVRFCAWGTEHRNEQVAFRRGIACERSAGQGVVGDVSPRAARLLVEAVVGMSVCCRPTRFAVAACVLAGCQDMGRRLFGGIWSTGSTVDASVGVSCVSRWW